MGKLIHEELSGTIIGVAMEVLTELKPGLDEKLYERAMLIKLPRRAVLGSTRVSRVGFGVPPKRSFLVNGKDNESSRWRDSIARQARRVRYPSYRNGV